MTTFAPPLAGTLPRRRDGSSARRALGLGGLGLVLVIVTSGGIALLFAGMVLAAVVSLLIWRHPGWAAVALIALLPVNRFLILLVFYVTGSSTATLAVQLWKDLFIAVLFVRAVHELLTGSRPRPRFLDLLVVAFIANATLYLVYPGPGLQLTFMNRVLGYRTDAFFLFAYVVGRAIPFDRRQLRWLLAGLVPGTVLVVLVAAGQFAWPGWFTDFINSLGFQDFAGGGFGEVEILRDRGIAGVDLPRASSLLLSDLALSFYCVFAAAVCASLYFTSRRPARAVLGAAVTAGCVATAVLTVTRSAVLASVLVVLVVAVLARAPGRSTVLLAVCALAALLALAANVIPAADLGALANPQEASVRGHMEAIRVSFDTLEEHPMGRGLGTAGTIGQRFIPTQALTNENWYLQIASELGVVAGLLFLVITVIAGFVALAALVRLRDLYLRRIALTVAAGSVGFFLMSNVLHAWEVPVLSMSFWLLAGVAASGQHLEGAST